jgi:hypothetical protein
MTSVEQAEHARGRARERDDGDGGEREAELARHRAHRVPGRPCASSIQRQVHTARVLARQRRVTEGGASVRLRWNSISSAVRPRVDHRMR